MSAKETMTIRTFGSRSISCIWSKSRVRAYKNLNDVLRTLQCIELALSLHEYETLCVRLFEHDVCVTSVSDPWWWRPRKRSMLTGGNKARDVFHKRKFTKEVDFHRRAIYTWLTRSSQHYSCLGSRLARSKQRVCSLINAYFVLEYRKYVL